MNFAILHSRAICAIILMDRNQIRYLEKANLLKGRDAKLRV